jgi:hypothetical protein
MSWDPEDVTVCPECGERFDDPTATHCPDCRAGLFHACLACGAAGGPVECIDHERGEVFRRPCLVCDDYGTRGPVALPATHCAGCGLVWRDGFEPTDDCTCPRCGADVHWPTEG